MLIFQSSSEVEVNEDGALLQSDSEKIRREKFEAILKLQEENSGLIETKKSEVLMPGMFLQRPITPLPQAEPDKETGEKLGREAAIGSETKSGSSSNRPGASNRPSANEHKKNSGMRKQKGRMNSRKQVQQWIRKDSGGSTN